MKILTFIAALFLVGCGQPIGEGSILTRRYPNNCLKNIYSSMDNLRQDYIDSDIELAQAIMVGSIDGLDSNEQFCQVFGEINISIISIDTWERNDIWGNTKPNCDQDDKNYTCVSGFYDVVSGITLNRQFRDLAHELIHHWETIHLVWGTWNHTNWDKKGYIAINDAYNKNQDMVVPNCTFYGYDCPPAGYTGAPTQYDPSTSGY